MRILLTSEDPLVQEQLSTTLLKEFPFVVTGKASGDKELMGLIRNEGWSLVVISLDAIDESWLNTLQSMHQEFPRLPVLLTSKEPTTSLGNLLPTGISYIDRESSVKELIKAVKIATQGRQYISPSIERKLNDMQEYSIKKLPHELLSAREFDVFKQLASGKTVSETSNLLHLGITTVSTYRTRLLAKMSMKSNAEIVAYARQHGLV